jgi:hypothetical protein
MSRMSLFELENHSDFIQRHIGPTVKQQTEMARAIGYDNLDHRSSLSEKTEMCLRCFYVDC